MKKKKSRKVLVPTFNSSQINKSDDLPPDTFMSEKEIMIENSAACIDALLTVFTEKEQKTLIFVCIRQQKNNDFIYGMVGAGIDKNEQLNISIPGIDTKYTMKLTTGKTK
jgi:hypothetical protein